MRPKTFPSQKGQNINEYALILGLVLMVLVITMVTLGDQIQGFFSQTGSHLAKTSPGASRQLAMLTQTPDQMPKKEAEHAPVISMPKFDMPPMNLPPDISLTPPKVTPEPKLNELKDYPEDPGLSVETAGVDGAMMEYALSIERMAEQMLAEGKIDQAGYLRLITFAQQIRKMARGTLKFEMAANPTTDGTYNPVSSGTKRTTPVVSTFASSEAFEPSQPDTESKLIALIQDPAHAENPFQDTNTHQYIITQMYVEMNADGTLKDPSAKAYIADTALQLTRLSNLIGDNAKASTSAKDLSNKVIADLKDKPFGSSVNCLFKNGKVGSGESCR